MISEHEENMLNQVLVPKENLRPCVQNKQNIYNSRILENDQVLTE
jgi:hypothetical protein